MVIEIDMEKIEKGSTILTVLRNMSINISTPCNGKGTCGKCRVKVISGKVKLGDANYKKLSLDEINNGICLSCDSFIEESCVIEIESQSEKDFDALSEYEHDDIENLRKRVQLIQIEESDIKKGICLTKYINLKTGIDYKYSLKSLKKLASVINTSKGEGQYLDYYNLREINLIIENKNVIDVCKVDETNVLGVAVDIGTTTIALSLINLLTGEVINTQTVLNAQRKYGADVISRIEYSSNGNLKKLKECVCGDIVDGIKNLISKDFSSENIHSVSIAANTTMLYLLMGLSCNSLAQYPFNAVNINACQYTFKEIFENDIIDCMVTILPCVSAYVGADIVAGVLKCKMFEKDKINLLIDIGTNGEMVIGNKDRMLCLATAAGPAFEGANITCGTGSIKGAISKVHIKDGKIEYETIKGASPVGICGSAVIDIVSECLKEEIINEIGQIDTDIYENKKIIIAHNTNNEEIFFNQKDISELQLAKSAIRSGIEILIKNFGCSYLDIDNVYIAGGFGNNISIENAAYIGLIPKELKQKVVTVGNTSLGGAIKYLLDEKSEKNLQYIGNHISYIDISKDSEFNKFFIDNMIF